MPQVLNPNEIGKQLSEQGSSKAKHNFLHKLRMALIQKKLPVWLSVTGILVFFGVVATLATEQKKAPVIVATPPPTRVPIPVDPSPTPDVGEGVGLTIVDQQGFAKVLVYRNSIAGKATLELWNIPAKASGYPEGLLSTEMAVSLRLVDWVQPAGYSGEFGFSKAFTIEFDSTKKDLSTFDLNKAVIVYWDQSLNSWRPLLTHYDEAPKKVTADSYRLGDYELLAPKLVIEK